MKYSVLYSIRPRSCISDFHGHSWNIAEVFGILTAAASCGNVVDW